MSDIFVITLHKSFQIESFIPKDTCNIKSGIISVYTKSSNTFKWIEQFFAKKITPKSKSNAKYNLGYICSIPQAANSFNSTPPDDKLQSSGANSFKLFQPHLMGNCRAQVQIHILSFYSHLDFIHHPLPALILIFFFDLDVSKICRPREWGTRGRCQ